MKPTIPYLILIIVLTVLITIPILRYFESVDIILVNRAQYNDLIGKVDNLNAQNQKLINGLNQFSVAYNNMDRILKEKGVLPK